MVATAVGDSIDGARLETSAKLADRLIIPNVRYRRDIGSNLIAGDYAAVQRYELLDP